MREALCLALWDGATYDTARLPTTADPTVCAFFAPDGAASAGSAGALWFELLQARPGLHYMVGQHHDSHPPVRPFLLTLTLTRTAPTAAWQLGLERGLAYSYELFPSVDNYVATLSSLLRTPLEPPPHTADGPPRPLWRGCALLWWVEGDERTPVIAMAPAGGASEDELRVVFNGQRHCYSVRNALASEPAWLQEVRRSWHGLWQAGRLPSEARVVAARLLRREEVLV